MEYEQELDRKKAFEECIEQAGGLEAVAEFLGIHPDYLKRLMASEVGCTLEKAIKLRTKYGVKAGRFYPGADELLEPLIQSVVTKDELLERRIVVADLDTLKRDHYRHVKQNAFERMKVSLSKKGQLRPIAVNEENQIIYGHTRWCAAKALGWKTIKVSYLPTKLILETPETLGIVYSLCLTERAKLFQFMMLAFKREALSPGIRSDLILERALDKPRPLCEVMQRKKMRVKERRFEKIAKKCGLGSKDHCDRLCKVLRHGIYDLHRFVDLGDISVCHARLMANLPPEAQEKYLEISDPKTWRAALKALEKGQPLH